MAATVVVFPVIFRLSLRRLGAFSFAVYQEDKDGQSVATRGASS
jgi:hypothetical protein